MSHSYSSYGRSTRRGGLGRLGAGLLALSLAGAGLFGVAAPQPALAVSQCEPTNKISECITDKALLGVVKTSWSAIDDDTLVSEAQGRANGPLVAGDMGITSIAGLQVLTGITQLELWNNQISDISPLKDLTRLTRLELDWNAISDVSPLKDLTNLATLNLEYNQIDDITGLAGLTNLTTLYLASNQIEDISALKDLTALTSLALATNGISDLSPISGLLVNLMNFSAHDQTVDLGEVGIALGGTHVVKSAVLPDGIYVRPTAQGWSPASGVESADHSGVEWTVTAAEDHSLEFKAEVSFNHGMQRANFTGSSSQRVIPTVTVSFDAHDGTPTPPARTVNAGTPVPVPDPAPTRPGYTLKGWSTDVAGQHMWDFATPVTAPMTLHAQWEPVPVPPVTHAVTFDAHGGTPTPAGQAVADGTPVALPDPAPTRSGYTLTGWSTDEAGQNMWDFATPVTGPMTLHAQWAPVPTPTPTPVPTQKPGGGTAATGADLRIAGVSAAVLLAGAGALILNRRNGRRD